MIIQITESRDYSEKALAIYKSLGPVYLSASPRKDANVLVLRLAYKIDSSWMDKMPNLKVIATPTTGLNHIDLKEAKKRKIKVISLKGHTSFLKDVPSTAEETLALMTALVRKLPWAFDDVKKGNWNRDAWRGHQFIHKTLGLLGCGRLGKIVAKYGKALGMRILGTDPNIDAGTLTRQSIEKVLMEKLFRESDIVSVHVSLEPDTHNLVQEKHLKMMKSTAYLINTARGEIIDEKALLKALENKWIAGAALDVMRDEVGGKHLKNNPLVKYAKTHDNLLIVPHLGGATYEAMHVTEDLR
ncbi:MAG: D-isomer specific 2-hydroxyacid dehydrogenase NAD-binding protein [Parcubacteria group bacterium GW2011_GWA1_48_11b]|nr:MAG: D-isomer specific 2-hydroxyacid dehydrogenase NAD-binding protein [Parcubacteria group bacterium GW2011_GWA1_48_11b]